MTKNGFSESETALRKLANDLQKDRETLEKIMAENTNQPLEKLHKDCERDNWLTADIRCISININDNFLYNLRTHFDQFYSQNFWL